MIRKSYVDVPDGQLHYRYTDTGTGPPLVFFHMTAASSEAYEPLMNELEGKYPLIAFDTINYGESYRTDRKADMGYIAETNLTALTNLGIDKFHTFGHHTGVAIQTEMAVQAPDRVLSTIMNGAPYAPLEDFAGFEKMNCVPNPISVKGTQLIWAWSRIKDNANTFGGRDEVTTLAHAMHRDVVGMLRAGEHWYWGYSAIFNYDLPVGMSKVQCPMFFLVGKRDPSYFLHCNAVAAFPDVPVHVNKGAGVYYMETHAAENAALSIEFIYKINSDLGWA